MKILSLKLNGVMLRQRCISKVCVCPYRAENSKATWSFAFSRETGSSLLLCLEDAGIERDQHLVRLRTGSPNLKCCEVLIYSDLTFDPLIRFSLGQVEI